jgi:hypothetical protein
MLHGHQVLSFFRPPKNEGDWSQQELGEFYRVEAALVSSGISVCTDRGLSDEGDPWFVFCRQDNDEVIVHFARIDGEYVIVSNLTEGVARGRDFNVLTRELLNNHPYILPKANQRRQTVYLHPAAMLAALVVTGYVKSAEMSLGPDENGRASEKLFGSFFSGHSLTTLSALVVATVWDTLASDPVHKLSELVWFDSANASDDHAALAVADAGTTHSSVDVSMLVGFDGFERAGSHNVFSADEAAKVSNGQADQTEKLATQGDHIAVSRAADQDAVSTADLPRTDKAGHAFDGRADADHNDQVVNVAQLQDLSMSFKLVADLPNSSNNLHGSSTLATSTVQFGFSSDAANAVSSVYEGLHWDLQSLHPVVLAAANLSDAVQATFTQLISASSASIPNSASTATASIASQASLAPTDLMAPAQSFDHSAIIAIQDFISHTPTWKIETFGSDILIVDTNLAHYTASQWGLESWRMNDGSTVSILGQGVHPSVAMA